MTVEENRRLCVASDGLLKIMMGESQTWKRFATCYHMSCGRIFSLARLNRL